MDAQFSVFSSESEGASAVREEYVMALARLHGADSALDREEERYTISAPQELFFDPPGACGEAVSTWLVVSGNSALAARGARGKEFGDLHRHYRLGLVELGLLYVEPSRRGEGVVPALLAQLIAVLPGTTTDLVVYMQSCVQSVRALKTYARNGFRVSKDVRSVPESEAHTEIDSLVPRFLAARGDYAKMPLVVLVRRLRSRRDASDGHASGAQPEAKRRLTLKPTPLPLPPGGDASSMGSSPPLLALSLRDLVV